MHHRCLVKWLKAKQECPYCKTQLDLEDYKIDVPEQVNPHHLPCCAPLWPQVMRRAQNTWEQARLEEGAAMTRRTRSTADSDLDWDPDLPTTSRSSKVILMPPPALLCVPNHVFCSLH